MAVLFIVLVVVLTVALISFNRWNMPRLKDGRIKCRGKFYPLAGARATASIDRRGHHNEKVRASITVEGPGFHITSFVSGKGSAPASQVERLAAAINARAAEVH